MTGWYPYINNRLAGALAGAIVKPEHHHTAESLMRHLAGGLGCGVENVRIESIQARCAGGNPRASAFGWGNGGLVLTAPQAPMLPAKPAKPADPLDNFMRAIEALPPAFAEGLRSVVRWGRDAYENDATDPASEDAGCIVLEVLEEGFRRG